MSERLRFRAPAMHLAPELRWLLVRAFAPPGWPAPPSPPLASARVVEVGARLDLLARVAARTPAALLAAELGPAGGAELARWREAAAVQVSCLQHLARQIAAVAAEVGTDIVFLKGTALHLAGIPQPGSRAMGDVDLLAPLAAAAALQDALVRAGHREQGQRQPSDWESGHLPPLVSPHGLVSEVHLRVKRVRLAADAPATADDLLAAGLVQPAPGLPPHCHLPSHDLLVAHLLVHGIAQHGDKPAAYAPARLLSDLADLAWSGDRWQAFFAGPFAWIAGEVTRREVAAVLAVVERLGRGDDPAAVARAGDDAAQVLRHLVAAAQAPSYLRELWLRRRMGGEFGPTSRSLLAAVWPPRAALDARLGAGAGAPTRVAWRLLRPFRVAWLAARWGVQKTALRARYLVGRG